MINGSSSLAFEGNSAFDCQRRGVHYRWDDIDISFKVDSLVSFSRLYCIVILLLYKHGTKIIIKICIDTVVTYSVLIRTISTQSKITKEQTQLRSRTALVIQYAIIIIKVKMDQKMLISCPFSVSLDRSKFKDSNTFCRGAEEVACTAFH